MHLTLQQTAANCDTLHTATHCTMQHTVMIRMLHKSNYLTMQHKYVVNMHSRFFDDSLSLSLSLSLSHTHTLLQMRRFDNPKSAGSQVNILKSQLATRWTIQNDSRNDFWDYVPVHHLHVRYEKFSKVSLLPDWLYRMTVETPFENICWFIICISDMRNSQKSACYFIGDAKWM